MFTKHRFPLRVLAMCSVLTACATRPEPRTIVQTVKVPVSVPCNVTVPEPPVYAGSTVSLTADVFVLAQAVMVEREQRKAYELALKAAAESCSETVTGNPPP